MRTQDSERMKTIKIYRDTDCENPRNWDNLGTIAYKHSRYTLGEETIDDPIDWLEGKLELDNKREYTNKRLEELEELFFEKFIAKPLYLYDHSGITIKTSPFSCPWDSGKVGYIYMEREEAEKQGWSEDWLNGRTIEGAAKDILDGEVETFDQYIRGDVYAFQIVDENDDVVDCYGGFYGDNWEENGMTDYIPKEFHDQLDNIEVEYL